MTTRARPAPQRVRWWKTLRIAALLLILVLVALTTLQDRYRSTRWREPLFVAIYPIAADESPATIRYVDSLDGGEFKPIDRFFARQAARYQLRTDEPFRSRLRPALEDRPPQRAPSAGPVATAFWSLKLRYWAWRVSRHAREPEDVRIFVLYHDPALTRAVPHSLGLTKGLIGVVYAFAAPEMTAENNVVIAHEILHTVGATDKYDPADDAPRFPDVDIGIESRVLVRGLNLSVEAGSILVLLGPNGCGKSLSLHTFAGLRAPQAGELKILDRPISAWPRRELARELALLPQNVEDPFPAKVLDTVLLGRHPHIGRWQWESALDVAIAGNSLAAVGLAGYEERDIFTLSGGERRRAALAAVLAQNPRIFLLDEPTNQLDPNHQIEALQLLRARADAGAAVIVTLHDPNLAARFADHALLIGRAGDWRWGGVAETLTSAHLSELYDTRFEELEACGRRVFYQA